VLIHDADFKARHRQKATDFTRSRSLVFPLVMLFVLRKGVKSLQLMVNEWFDGLGLPGVTASAYSRARHRLKHTAFIELNQKAVVEVCYADGDHLRFRGFRVLGIDGSKVRLPETADITAAFGQIRYGNQDPNVTGVHTWALASVLYDVLNRVALDASLGAARAYEVDLAIDHLARTRPGDLILTDRNYPSYRFLASAAHAGCEFASRCSTKSFSAARAMLRGEGADSQTAVIRPDPAQRLELAALGLPATLNVRFVRVTLPGGEYEVLVTSLLDESLYPTAMFLELYGLRWGVEGFYGRVKTRLGLENFTGQSAESVRQDFHSTVYLTGLETLLTADAQAQLAEKDTLHAYQVNHAVSFNAIKNRALDLLDCETDLDRLADRLTALFLKNPTCVRPERETPRLGRSLSHRLDYQQRRKKACF